jgi:hypothetical protein
MDAGCSMRLSAPPSETARWMSRTDSTSVTLALNPPLSSNEIMPPKLPRVREKKHTHIHTHTHTHSLTHSLAYSLTHTHTHAYTPVDHLARGHGVVWV